MPPTLTPVEQDVMDMLWTYRTVGAGALSLWTGAIPCRRAAAVAGHGVLGGFVFSSIGVVEVCVCV